MSTYIGSFQVGDTVKHDDGRTGEIIEIEGARARILWFHKSIRTWINFRYLTKLQ